MEGAGGGWGPDPADPFSYTNTHCSRYSLSSRMASAFFPWALSMEILRFLAACGAETGLTDSLQHAETRKRTGPFPRVSLESPGDPCHVGEVPWEAPKLQLPLSRKRFTAFQQPNGDMKL
ncbi:hypothetical protein EYF80_058776 [Liparis tanakae]|uniref:Uncharacterized protein n=1 Tax=Liparis tanakae TaxID=230148 RepID=A0A4Z2ES10_9TELE|nr:hypothetical protein EYF80_058776 [Liparis tanakae]